MGVRTGAGDGGAIEIQGIADRISVTCWDDEGLSLFLVPKFLPAGNDGMALGAVLFGPLGDRYGRRAAVLWATAVFGVFSLLTAFASSIEQLMVLRFLTGIGMGGAAPNVYTLASEFSPARHRGLVMLVAGLGLPVGAIVGGLIAGSVIPAWGWQGVFILGLDGGGDVSLPALELAEEARRSALGPWPTAGPSPSRPGRGRCEATYRIPCLP